MPNTAQNTLLRIEKRLTAIERKQDEMGSKMVTNEELKKTEKRLKRQINTNHREAIIAIARVATSSPTIKQFKALEDKVERHHPSN